jgi:hypothetical protein
MLVSAAILGRTSEAWAHSPGCSHGERAALRKLRECARAQFFERAARSLCEQSSTELFVADVPVADATPLARAAARHDDGAALVVYAHAFASARADADADDGPRLAMLVCTSAYTTTAARPLLRALARAYACEAPRERCDAAAAARLVAAAAPHRVDTLRAIETDLRATRHSLLLSLDALAQRGSTLDALLDHSNALLGDAARFRDEARAHAPCARLSRLATAAMLRLAAALDRCTARLNASFRDQVRSSWLDLCNN